MADKTKSLGLVDTHYPQRAKAFCIKKSGHLGVHKCAVHSDSRHIAPRTLWYTIDENGNLSTAGVDIDSDNIFE